MAEDTESPAFAWVYRGLKLVAIGGGGAVTILSLMSVAGAVTENGWVRLIAALVIAIGVPLIVSDRLLPEGEDVVRARGLPTDVFAVAHLGFALLFVALPFTSALLVDEGDRLARGGFPTVARAAWVLAGADPVAPSAEPDGEASTTTGDVSDGGVVPDAAASIDGARSGDAGPASDAGPATAAPAGTDLAPAAIFQRWAPSVVSIQVSGGGGTGFVISDDGLVATNSHVIHGQSDVKVKLKDGTWADEVWLLTESVPNDLALLRIVATARPDPVVMGDSDDVEVGERAVSIGNPLGLEHTLTDGLISSRRVYEGRRMIQMSTPVSPGNSGGPLFNARGEVVGVTTLQVAGGMFGRAQNLNLATPINTLKSMIQPQYPDERRIGGGGGDSGGTW